MAFDFKKEYKELYAPKKKPSIIDVPTMNYLAVRGEGNPNEEDGAYKQAVGALYSIAYTLRMSYKGNYKIEGFFEYVVPPLEGFWWQEGVKGVDYTNKESFQWISLIRLPDFITEKDVDWAKEEATRKKNADVSMVEFFTYKEGLCVQCMHIGPYDNEPETVALMSNYIEENGYSIDITSTRYHHEIYISNPNKAHASKLKTIIRHPIKKV